VVKHSWPRDVAALEVVKKYINGGSAQFLVLSAKCRADEA
jgi:hypothetical protein